MQIALLQADLIWENPIQNLANFSIEIMQLVEKNEKVDILVLPEMFTTGFSMNPAAFAENVTENDGKDSGALTVLRTWARLLDALVIGSIIATENGKFHNRLLAVKPDMTFEYYDKRHLFAFANEDKHYTAGTEKLLIEWRGWRIMPLVCYDLRFPVWSRNTSDYDLLIYVANWPERRAAHWQTLLRARAIENQAYTIGVNRVGTDANGLFYSGDSAVIDPLGNTVFEHKNEPIAQIITIEKAHLEDVRVRLPFLKDRDTFVFL